MKSPKVISAFCVAFLTIPLAALAEDGASTSELLGTSSIYSVYYEQYLGSAKDNPEALVWLADSYNAPDPKDRFKAYLAIKRLGEFPSEQLKQVGFGISMLINFIGKPYKPAADEVLMPDIRIPKPEEEQYPVEETLIKIGKNVTPYILKSFYASEIYPTEQYELRRNVLGHRAEVLAAIEGREQAEKLLLDTARSFDNEYVLEDFAISVATLRARQGLERDAETPQDKFEQELQRVRDELSREKSSETPDARPVTPSGSETQVPPIREPQGPVAEAAPFPWAIVIVVAIAALSLGAITTLLLTRKNRRGT